MNVKRYIITEKRLHTICYVVCIFLFAIGHTKIQQINFLTRISVRYGKFIPLFISAIVLFRSMKINKKMLALITIFFLLLLQGYLNNDLSYTTFFIAYFMVACKKEDSSIVFKYYSISVFVIILITIFLSWVGIIINDNSWPERWDLGFIYCTYGPNLFLSASISLIAWKKNKTTVSDWIFMILLNRFFFWKTNTDAVYLCFMGLFILWVLMRSNKITRFMLDNKISVYLLSHCTMICLIITIVLQLFYNSHYMTQEMVLLNRYVSNRLFMGMNVFSRYLSGTGIIKDLLFGLGPERTSYLDSSYLAILTSYGLPLLLFFCLMFDNISAVSIKLKDIYVPICILVFAIHCISDPHLSSFRENPIIITALFYIEKRKRMSKSIDKNV